MPLTIAPNLIEQTDFSQGVATVPDDASLPMEVLTDVMNLLPDEAGTGTLITREGFTVFTDDMIQSGHYIKNIFKFRRGGVGRLIVVTTDGTASSNNVRIYEVNLATAVATRIDTAGVTWLNPTADHTMVNVDDKIFGSSPGNDWYSWDGTTWDDDAATGNWKTLVDDINGSVDTDTEYGRDYAFTGKEHVIYDSDVFVPQKGIRFRKWNDNTETAYAKGQKVSHKASFGSSGSDSYWKSFRCIQEHEPDLVDAEPGVGADWKDYWQKIRLGLPKNDDGETTDDWYFQIVPHGTSVSGWYADRVWARGDHVTGKDNLLYSAPLKPDKGSDVGDVVFNFKDWAPGNDIRGVGGGWLPINDGHSHGIITGFRPFQSYALVFKRQAVWAITGRSEPFTPRKLIDGVGCVGNNAHTVLDGLVYFLDDQGLYVTDGTSVEAVPNNAYIARDLETRMDTIETNASGYTPTVVEWRRRIYISLPITSGSAGSKHRTYVYDPQYQSWWITNLPILAAKSQRTDGQPSLYFGAPVAYGSAYLYKLTGTTDADGAGGAAAEIDWSLTTSWWSFGAMHEDRRVRRTWGLVKGVAQTYTLTQYRNYSSSSSAANNRAETDTARHYIEGAWIPDSHAIKLKLAGTKAETRVSGIAVDTQPRRRRYHRTP